MKKRRRPPLAERNLSLRHSATGSILTRTSSSTDDAQKGIIDFGLIKGGTYVLVETVPPPGYQRSLDTYTLVASEELKVFHNGFEVTDALVDIPDSKRLVVSNTPDTITIPVSKAWLGGGYLGERPPVTIELLADGLPAVPFGSDAVIDPIVLDGITDTIEQDPWRAAFVNLPRLNATGSPVLYTLRETSIGGIPVVEDTANLYRVTLDQKNFQVTNTYVSPMRSVYAQKIWVGGPLDDHIPPTMHLYQNGHLYSTVPDAVIPSSGPSAAFEFEWKELPLTDPTGRPYQYFADEAGVPEGYGKSISGTGTQDYPFVITNTFGANVTDIAAQKDWVDGPVPRPTITLQLQRKIATETAFTDVGDAIVLASGVHIYIWKEQPIADGQGAAFEYRVVETAIGADPVLNGVAAGYSVTAGGTWSTGLSVTNTYIPPQDPSGGPQRVSWRGSSHTQPDRCTTLPRNCRRNQRVRRAADRTESPEQLDLSVELPGCNGSGRRSLPLHGR